MKRKDPRRQRLVRQQLDAAAHAVEAKKRGDTKNFMGAVEEFRKAGHDMGINIGRDGKPKTEETSRD